MFLHQQLTKRLIGVFYDVYNELGFGLLESVYHRALEVAFREHGIRFRSNAPVPVGYHGHRVGQFWADLLVEDVVIVELKACCALDPAHEAQLLNYLRDRGRSRVAVQLRRAAGVQTNAFHQRPEGRPQMTQNTQICVLCVICG